MITPGFRMLFGSKAFLMLFMIPSTCGVRAVKHGTGKTRKPYMNLQYTPHVLGIMKSIKKAFDPNNILNPGVIIDLDD